MGMASLLYIHPAFPTSATPLFDFVEAFHTSHVKTPLDSSSAPSRRATA